MICLGCRERRIRCELPSEVELPEPGELRAVQTPCYRCQRLGVPCVVRQTILGRPGLERRSITARNCQPTNTEEELVPRIVIEPFPKMAACVQSASGQDDAELLDSFLTARNRRLCSNDSPPIQGKSRRLDQDLLLFHNPQSNETVLIMRALDTLRCEKLEDEWYRHLPTHVGHTPALDLSIKAIVAACAYGRGVPKVTLGDCYQVLAVALNAVQANIKQSQGQPNDDILAATALLAPFEGALKKDGIPTRPHIEGQAAILVGRSPTQCYATRERDPRR